MWLPDYDLPGLAMSRSIGDYQAHKYGVIAKPEVSEVAIEPEDAIIVVGSDGLFEFMSNSEIAQIVIDF